MADYRNTPISRKANEQAREAIASILLMEVSDPRLQRITVTSVDVSPDKRNARIYYTAAKSDYKAAEESLASASGYIRKLLGGRLGWRVVPELHFHLDPSIDMGEIISSAFIKEERRKAALGVSEREAAFGVDECEATIGGTAVGDAAIGAESDVGKPEDKTE